MKKNIRIDINAEDLKKKLKIKDGYTPVKGVDYFDGEPGVSPDPAVVAIEASKLTVAELEPKIKSIAPFKLTDKDIEVISLDVQALILPNLNKEIEALKKGFSTFKPTGGNTEVFEDGVKRGSGQALNFGTGFDVTHDGHTAYITLDPAEDPLTLTLQDVTDNGNTTTNTIEAAGLDVGTSAHVAVAGEAYFEDTDIVLSGGLIQHDITNNTSPSEGQVNWNSDDGTLQVGMPGGNVALQLGQEMHVRAKNSTGSTITNGSVVYVSGASGQRPTVALADADLSNSHDTIGVATEDIGNGQNGYITTFGYVRGLNTSALTEGNTIYLSQTAGALTSTAPATPAHKVKVGRCIYQHATEGIILVHVEHGGDISDSDDVLITSIGDNELLQYNSGLGYWENQTLAEADIQTASGATTTYVPYTGATTGVNLGAQTLTTTGHINGGKVNITSTTEQFKSGYDANSYWTATTGMDGKTTFRSEGTNSAIAFRDDNFAGSGFPAYARMIDADTQTVGYFTDEAYGGVVQILDSPTGTGITIQSGSNTAINALGGRSVFSDGSQIATLADGTYAVNATGQSIFSDGTNTTRLADGTYAINASGAILTNNQFRSTGSWTNGQLDIGTTNQAGRIILRRGSDGTNQAQIGFSTALSSGGLIINSAGGAASLSLQTNSQTRLYSNANGEIGINTTSPLAQLQVNTSSASTKGLILKASASQTANLTEWQTSAGTVIDRVDQDGYIHRGDTIEWSETKSLPAGAGGFIELGTMLNTSTGQIIEIMLQWYTGGNAQSRKYVVCNAYNALTTSWLRLEPIFEYNNYANAVELDTQNVGSNMKFRIIAPSTTNRPSTVAVTYKIINPYLRTTTRGLSTVWTASSTTGTDTSTLNPYPYTVIRQRQGELQIANKTSSTGYSKIVAKESQTGETGTGTKGLNLWNSGRITADGSFGNSGGEFYGMTVSVPNTTNDYCEFATISTTSFNCVAEIWTSVRQGGYAVSKRYLVPMTYNATGTAWHKLIPISSTGVYSGNDQDLEININAGTATLRVRRVSGAMTSATMYVGLLVGAIESTVTVTQINNTGSTTAPTVAYAPTSISQINGNVGIGGLTADAPNANAILDLSGNTTKAFIPPKMTTTQKNAISSPTGGMIVFDTTLNKLCVYGASSWETITSS